MLTFVRMDRRHCAAVADCAGVVHVRRLYCPAAIMGEHRGELHLRPGLLTFGGPLV